MLFLIVCGETCGCKSNTAFNEEGLAPLCSGTGLAPLLILHFGGKCQKSYGKSIYIEHS